jgi:hypothetical protein
LPIGYPAVVIIPTYINNSILSTADFSTLIVNYSNGTTLPKGALSFYDTSFTSGVNFTINTTQTCLLNATNVTAGITTIPLPRTLVLNVSTNANATINSNTTNCTANSSCTIALNDTTLLNVTISAIASGFHA